ncbi:hypothetical protein QYE76_061084 [Lolium multiflorum]|uniref:Uncharacterized protein n=1 Tax=Lolium multiflorum TaxID=4521 RepID=A0AAD8W6V5_LOLMU|nr:hypothetical protein QYE76_061084 [Lolium multiflorum]
MELAIEECGALDHINGEASADPDPDWRTVDLILKRWIYDTISSELTGMIMDSSRTAQSSAEVEYRVVAHVVAESCWIHNLLQELHRPIVRLIVVYCDNVFAVYLSVNPVQHLQTKHIEIDIHFVRDKVQIGEVWVLHIPTASQYADIFTNGLPSAAFVEFRSSLTVHEPPANTEGHSLKTRPPS